MTTAVLSPAPAASTSASRLLRVDAALSAAVGLPMAIVAGAVADLLGTGAVGVVRWVGVAFLVYALDLAVVSRTRWAGRTLRVVALGNLAYEVGSLTVAALADLSATGRVLVAVQGLVVGALGLLQLRASRG